MIVELQNTQNAKERKKEKKNVWEKFGYQIFNHPTFAQFTRCYFLNWITVARWLFSITFFLLYDTIFLLSHPLYRFIYVREKPEDRLPTGYLCRPTLVYEKTDCILKGLLVLIGGRKISIQNTPLLYLSRQLGNEFWVFMDNILAK